MNLRKVIAVDIDDVLSASAEGFAMFSNDRWDTSFTAQDYDEDFAKAWGLSDEEALERLEDFLTSGAHGRYAHFEDALPVLQRLAKSYDLIVVTSRRLQLKPETDAWLARHFPGVFQASHHAGFFDNPNKDYERETLKHTKALICQQLGAQYLIDDQLKHCIAAAECGIETLLYGEYRWNQTDKPLPKRVTRVSGWDEVGEYFHV